MDDEIVKFLQSLDEFGKQALADCIADGSFPPTFDDHGTQNGIAFTPEGLKKMEAREEELRRLAN